MHRSTDIGEPRIGSQGGFSITRTIRILTSVLALVLTLPAASAAPAAEAGADLGPVDVLLAPGTQHGEETPELSACSGYAPLITECKNEHTVHNDYGHTCTGGPDYTGTIVSNAYFSPDIQSTVTCHYVDGELQERTVDNPGFFISESRFTHTCTSYDLRTTTEGGSGVWSCLFAHS